MTGLAEWLLEAIAEDERIIRYASVNRSRSSLQLDVNGIPVTDPARVRAECRAKRQIVTDVKSSRTFHCEDWAERVLRLLAAPYADRPGFREEWRV